MQREIIKNINQSNTNGGRRNAELNLIQDSTLFQSSHDDLKLFDNMALLGPSTGIYNKKTSPSNMNQANKSKRNKSDRRMYRENKMKINSSKKPR